jgi:hypothetical protein
MPGAPASIKYNPMKLLYQNLWGSGSYSKSGFCNKMGVIQNYTKNLSNFDKVIYFYNPLIVLVCLYTS